MCTSNEVNIDRIFLSRSADTPGPACQGDCDGEMAAGTASDALAHLQALGLDPDDVPEEAEELVGELAWEAVAARGAAAEAERRAALQATELQTALEKAS